ncbi:MAG TPA: hypothetical protein VFL07_12990 [Rudaea sp.]|nr:hypothetical protein [Rudaea sp.]HSC11008.1 hypothetical protein [Rhodanobacteraceae bacterium]
MNAMRAIYVRSVVLVLGFAALLLIEQLAPPPASVPGKAPTAAVGSGHSPA